MEFRIRHTSVWTWRNTSERVFGFAKLPIRQTLFWLGPIFIIVRPS
jgi:hypothetical protein